MDKMSRQAKTLSDDQLNQLLIDVAQSSKHPLRDYAVIFFSFKAGLRAGEIAKLDWRDVVDARGQVGVPDQKGRPMFTVPAQVAKKGHMRQIPMHPALKASLEQLKAVSFPAGTVARGRIVKGTTATNHMSPNTLQRYLGRLYKRHGYDCSSHSGRRTMITKAIRSAPNHDCSIKDVQAIAGHKFIDTTERYIDLSDSVADLVNAI